MKAETRVGLVVLAFFLVVLFFAFKIGGDRWPWREDDGYRIAVFFETSTGLENKSIVRYAGVEVGVVEKITLESGRAKVVLKLNKDVQVRRDAQIEIGSMGLMGEKFITIKGGSASAPFLQSGDTITGKTPVGMDQLVTAINDIGVDIKAITGSMREAIGDQNHENKLADIVSNIDRLTATLANSADDNDEDLREIVRNFREISGSLSNIIRSNETQINGTVQDLHVVVQALADSMPEITRDLKIIMSDIRQLTQNNQDNLNDTLDHVAVASRNLDETLQNLNTVVQRVERGEGTVGKLINDDEFHENLNTAIKDIDKTAVELRSLFGTVSDYKLFLGYRGEYLSEVEETKTYVSLKLQPRPDKYYLLELVSTPYGQYFEDEYEYVFDDPVGDLPASVSFTRKKWEKRKLLYTLQLAKRYHNFTFRGGLIESTGGFGMDLDLFKDHLQFSLEGWDFARDEDPHLKVGGRWNITENLFVVGGWDDFLLNDRNGDNYYFGAGIHFHDEDLKLLLGFLPMVSGN